MKQKKTHIERLKIKPRSTINQPVRERNREKEW